MISARCHIHLMLSAFGFNVMDISTALRSQPKTSWVWLMSRHRHRLSDAASKMSHFKSSGASLHNSTIKMASAWLR